MKFLNCSGFSIVCLVLALCGFIGCDKNENLPPEDGTALRGTGDYVFDSFAPLSDKPVRVYYHVPEGASALAPVLVVFHGAGRNAESGRAELIGLSDEKGFLLVVPEFSDTYFPGSDAYNLGNIFEDGDNPSPATLNPEELWTFSIVSPLVDDFKERAGNVTSRFDVFGHSAGGQFAHRLLLFKPEIAIERMAASASGWYTVPDPAITFPYGLAESPAESADMSVYFGQRLIVMVGALDNDPNAPDLRRNEWADAQGLNRVARAEHFFQSGGELAGLLGSEFRWAYNQVPNTGHDFGGMAAAAIEIIY